MHYLSRANIEKIAERVICKYKNTYVSEKHMCYMVDATELAEMLGYKIDYVHITRDGSILSQTSSGNIQTSIYVSNMNEVFFLLDGKTILIEKRLLNSPKSIGRKNFTIAHKLAHQTSNNLFSKMDSKQNRSQC